MRRRLLIATGLLLAGVLGLVFWQASGPREPVFEGQKLTRWLDHHVADSSAKPPYGSPGWKKADEALRLIGTNAIPTLLTLVRAKDPPPLALKLIDFAAHYRWTRINYRYACRRHAEAEYAFRVLGTNGVSAVPELIRIYEEAVSPSSQRCAVLALGDIGPGAQAALPALLRNFNHTNNDVRFYAVSAVLHIGGDPNILVPALKGMLKDPKPEVRFNAAAALWSFGGSARTAIQELLEALQDQDQSVKEEVENVLWSLAPEKVARPLVVEDATPMVSNGVTTEALFREASGEFWTLIPKDTAVRRTVYQSVMTPPPLYLYRGLSKTTTNDHFLGRFEAIVPSPGTNISFEVVYIIDHQQILLCARDYNRKQFVELRRVENDTAK